MAVFQFSRRAIDPGKRPWGKEGLGVTPTIIAFTEVGEHTWEVPAGVSLAHVLVVAGGGGGGNSRGGGGGAGGLIFYPNYPVSGSSINIKVGAGGLHVPGGNPGTNGEDSEFGDLVAIGGGGAGAVSNSSNPDEYNGKPGGSGGGGRVGYDAITCEGGAGEQSDAPGNSGSPYGFGHDGATSAANSDQSTGGGGAGGPGTAAARNGNIVGGPGLKEITIDGITYNFAALFGTTYGDIDAGEAWFASGGAGTENKAQPGGGGEGAQAGNFAGKSNTGGGGGGGQTNDGTNGGSGIVIIRY